MKVVEVAEAAGRFAELVAEAEQGESVLFARSGRVIARLQPVGPYASEAEVAAALEGMKRLHDGLAARGVSVSDEEIRAMRDDHRG